MAAAVGSRALVPRRGRRERGSGTATRRSASPRTGKSSIKLPAPLAHLANAEHGRYVLALQGRFRAPGRGVAGPDRGEPGGGLPHPLRRGAQSLVPHRVLAASRGQDYSAGGGTGRGHDRGGHQRRSFRRVPPRRLRQPGRRPAPVPLRPVRHRRSPGRAGPARHHPPPALGRATAASRRSASRTWTSHRRRPARNTAATSGSGNSSPASRQASSRPGSCPWPPRLGLSVVAVDPAYTSMWGDQHWRKPLAAPRRTMTRHDAASVAIGRRALGHPIRRRTAPPRDDQSDRRGHRTAQAGPGTPGREGTRPPVTERAHDAHRRTGTQQGTRGTSASRTVRDARSAGTRAQDPLLLTD